MHDTVKHPKSTSHISSISPTLYVLPVILAHTIAEYCTVVQHSNGVEERDILQRGMGQITSLQLWLVSRAMSCEHCGVCGGI